MGHGAGKCDDKGFSFADHLQGTDQGGYAPGAPVPLNPQDMQKFERRKKEAWSLLYRHIRCKNLRAIVSAPPFFQDGAATMQYMDAMYHGRMLRSDIDELDAAWRNASITTDIGVCEQSVEKFSQLLLRLNGERPARADAGARQPDAWRGRRRSNMG